MIVLNCYFGENLLKQFLKIILKSKQPTLMSLLKSLLIQTIEVLFLIKTNVGNLYLTKEIKRR